MSWIQGGGGEGGSTGGWTWVADGQGNPLVPGDNGTAGAGASAGNGSTPGTVGATGGNTGIGGGANGFGSNTSGTQYVSSNSPNNSYTNPFKWGGMMPGKGQFQDYGPYLGPSSWWGVPFLQGDTSGRPLSNYHNLLDQYAQSHNDHLAAEGNFNRWNFGGPNSPPDPRWQSTPRGLLTGDAWRPNSGVGQNTPPLPTPGNGTGVGTGLLNPPAPGSNPIGVPPPAGGGAGGPPPAPAGPPAPGGAIPDPIGAPGFGPHPPGYVPPPPTPPPVGHSGFRQTPDYQNYLAGVAQAAATVPSHGTSNSEILQRLFGTLQPTQGQIDAQNAKFFASQKGLLPAAGSK